MRSSVYHITRHPVFHLFALTLVLFGVGWTVITPLIFFSSDIGLRFLQIRMLIAQQWQTLAIPYPTAIDPNFEYVPYYYAYSLVNGRLLFNISPFYPYLASLLYASLGLAGLVLSPIIGTLLTAWGVYSLAITSKLPRPLVVMWAAVFATPVFFYSLQLWDHTLGTGLAILGTAWIAQGMSTQNGWRTAVGGLLLGWAIGQRPELYLFLLAVGLAWLFTNFRTLKSIIPLLGGGLAGVIPVWLLQWRWVGHPLGMVTAPQLSGYGRPEVYPVESYIRGAIPPAVKMGRLLFQIDSHDPLTFSAAIVTMMGLVLLVFAVRVPRFQKSAVLWAGAILTLLGYAAWIVVAWRELVGGLVSTCSLLALSVALVDRSENNRQSIQVYRFVIMTAILFVAIMLFAWPSFGGLQWGARYLLPTYPLFVYLAFYAARSHGMELKRPLRASLQSILIFLLLIGTVLQTIGLRHLYLVIDEMAPVRDNLDSSSADVIITNQIFTPWFMSGVEGKALFYVDSHADLATLITSLYANNMRTLALLPAEPGEILMPDQINGITVIPIGAERYQLEAAE